MDACKLVKSAVTGDEMSYAHKQVVAALEKKG